MPLTARPGGESREKRQAAQKSSSVCRSITGHDCVTNNHMTNEWTYSSRLWDAAAGVHDTTDALKHLSFSVLTIKPI